MATQFFGLNRGERLESVSTGTSTTSKAIELAVNDAVNLTKGEVIQAIETLEIYLLNQRTTPFK